MHRGTIVVHYQLLLTGAMPTSLTEMNLQIYYDVRSVFIFIVYIVLKMLVEKKSCLSAS